MTPLLFLSMSVAGGLGGVARFTLDKFISARTSSSTPWGTFFINLSGSLLLGLLTGLTISQTLSPQRQIIIGTGFLGGYTTFSTASCDAVFSCPSVREPDCRGPTRSHTHSLDCFSRTGALAGFQPDRIQLKTSSAILMPYIASQEPSEASDRVTRYRARINDTRRDSCSASATYPRTFQRPYDQLTIQVRFSPAPHPPKLLWSRSPARLWPLA